MRTIAWWTLWTMKTKHGQNWTWLHDPLWQQQNSTAIPLNLGSHNLCNTHMDAYGRISNTKLDNPIRQQQKSTTVPRSVVANALPQIQGATESINMDRGWRTHQTGRRSCRRELKSRPPRLRGEIREVTAQIRLRNLFSRLQPRLRTVESMSRGTEGTLQPPTGESSYRGEKSVPLLRGETPRKLLVLPGTPCRGFW
jgi:hypothetical protein